MRPAHWNAIAAVLVLAAAWLLIRPEPALAPSPPTPPPTAIATQQPVAAEDPFARPIPEGYRVRMPRLGIDLPILEGDIARDTVAQQTPEDAAFRLPLTGIPGAGSNTFIYAHARRGMFLSLWNARVGDAVIIVAPDGRELRYEVSEVHPRVSPDEVHWTVRTATERLTLQTSTGPQPQDPRFIVVAVPR